MSRLAMGLHVQGSGANGAAAVYIRKVRPSMVKFMDGAADPALVALARDVGSLTVLRVYWQDQDRAQLDSYHAEIERAVRRNPGIEAVEVSFNEAHQRGDDLSWKAAADIAGMALAERLGKKAVIGSFSVGTPEPGDWAAYRPALERAHRGGHYLGLHEYGGGSQGMRIGVESDGRGWFTLRYRRLIDWAASARLDLPRILITESGIDHLDQADRDTRGFRAMPAGYDYAADLVWYARELGKDWRVCGWCDFGWAADDPAWHPYDLSRDAATLDQVMNSQAAIPSSPSSPLPAPRPPEGPTMPDLGAMLAAEFGALYSDVRSSLPRNPNGPAGDFSRRALGSIDILAVHHTAADRAQSWQTIARAHIDGRGWAGIGYHIGIRLGSVAYIGDVGLARACCLDQNHRVLCVVVTGNYETDQMTPADASALRRVAAVAQRWSQAQLGRPLRVLGHREVPGQQTACPGRNLLPLVHELAGVTAAPPPVATGPNMGKVVWAMEDSTRKLEREGLLSEAAFVATTYTADAIRRRDHPKQ